jgi:hypothetical protein
MRRNLRSKFKKLLLAGVVAGAVAAAWTPQAYLFGANEPGFHAETYDPQSLLTRRNVLTFTEFPNGTADLNTVGTLVTASALTGYDGAIAVGWDGVTGQQAYKSVSTSWAVGRGVLSVIVKMDDGGVPAFDNLNNSNHDFTLVAGSTNVTPLGSYTVEALGGGFYRVWALATPGGGSNYGVQKTATNSSRTFVTSGWSFEPNVSTPGAYQKVTDWNAEYMAAALNSIGMWQNATGTTPVTGVEQPVGLWFDTKRGYLFGAERFSTVAAAGGQARNVNSTLTGSTSTSLTVQSVAAGTYGVNFTSLLSVAQQHSRLRFRVSGTAGKSLSINFGGATASVITTATPTTYVAHFLSPSFATALDVFISAAAAGEVFTFEILSLIPVEGNVAKQVSSASRPILSARYNLLTKTEQFDDPAWSKTGVTVSANATTDPLGGTTADTLSSTSAGDIIYQSFPTVAGSYRWGVRCKAGTASTVKLQQSTGGNGYSVTFTLTGAGSAAAAVQAGTGGTVSAVSGEITALSDGWYLCELLFTTSGTINNVIIYPGNGAGLISVWGADLRTTNDAALNQPAYQRVNTSTDYDTTDFIHYLKWDGVDDSLYSSSPINFSGTDKILVCVGATNLSAGAYGGIAGLSANANDIGAFLLWTRTGTGALEAYTKGNGVPAYQTENGSPGAPRSTVVTALLDNAAATQAEQVRMRINGAVPATTASAAVTTAGNHANATLTFGNYNSANPFSGRMTSVTVRGSTTATSEAFIRSMEQYAASLAGKTFASA